GVWKSIYAIEIQEVASRRISNFRKQVLSLFRKKPLGQADRISCAPYEQQALARDNIGAASLAPVQGGNGMSKWPLLLFCLGFGIAR
ncbi:MAG TPA: hypothetical protein VE734_04770, partial [Terriglobales bacterium]|nr:hypothetical protein [Terriglobales bacterium]